MRDKLKSELEREIEGDVKFDVFSRNAYSTDASIYQIQPIGIVSPRSNADILIVNEIAKSHGIPLIPRGAGTGITGGCLGKALILDFSKYLYNIESIDYNKQEVICQPGVIQDQLNNRLSKQGYRLGPDTSTGNRATIGGMLANNSSGAHSMRYGKMVDNVIAAEVILSSGAIKQCNTFDQTINYGSKNDDSKFNTQLANYIRFVRENLADEITNTYPKIRKRVSGYNLDEIINAENVNLAKLIAGSEGTLGITSEITLKICRNPNFCYLYVLFFHDLIDCLSFMPGIYEYDPYSIELIDDKIVTSGRVSPALKGKLDWLNGEPGALLLVEFDSESESALKKKSNHFERHITNHKTCYHFFRAKNNVTINNIWQLRKTGLGLLMAKRTNERAIAFLEDITIPPETVADFIVEFRSYIKEKGKESGIYGHAGEGCIHFRPMLDLKQQAETELMFEMLDDISSLVKHYGGTLSGEHGDGIVRSWLIEKMFGKKICDSFRELKAIFDPENRMNPGKIVNPLNPRENLRTNPHQNNIEIKTVQDFKIDGGFSFAIEMCNGNGECRKINKGVMCPSFQVTGDERDTTRARAQSLMSVVKGIIPEDEFTGKNMYTILDLCLQCKGCKKECPSQIDMAKMKSEFLYHYHKKHGQPLRNKIFGNIDRISHVSSIFPRLSNCILNSKLSRYGLKTIGIHPSHSLTTFSKQPFSKWYKLNHKFKHKNYNNSVILFIDTFTEYNHPEIGIAAYNVLKQLGKNVIVPEIQCCGRPLISKGFLDEAKLKAYRLHSSLANYVEQGYDIIGLEPSCIFTLKDDYSNLLNIDTDKLNKFIAACISIDSYLEKIQKQHSISDHFKKLKNKIVFHGHCHQKSLEGSEPSIRVLESLLQTEVEEINSGCCGMAGSFGYETEHYQFSQKIGESRLFPKIRSCNNSDILIANGTSCRQQIIHGTKADVKHLIQVLEQRLL